MCTFILGSFFRICITAALSFVEYRSIVYQDPRDICTILVKKVIRGLLTIPYIYLGVVLL